MKNQDIDQILAKAQKKEALNMHFKKLIADIKLLWKGGAFSPLAEIFKCGSVACAFGLWLGSLNAGVFMLLALFLASEWVDALGRSIKGIRVYIHNGGDDDDDDDAIPASPNYPKTPGAKRDQ